MKMILKAEIKKKYFKPVNIQNKNTAINYSSNQGRWKVGAEPPNFFRPP